jgi:HK97 family phage prohead protease
MAADHMEVSVDFKVYTNALKAYEAPNGDLIVTGTTSSTIRDLHGDEMTLNAISSMAETARQNMTIFLNHNYNVPEDLFGSVTDARIVKRFDAETNAEVYDLDIDVLVCKEDENPEAMRAYKAIKRGVKLGLSIGARVDRVSKRKDAKTGEDSYVIDSVKLMEASVVGIPANQRSYLQNAIKSLKAAENAGEIILEEKADGLSIGDFVSWGSSGGTARGEITRVVRKGTINVPDSNFTITGTPEDPAALIRVYRKNSEGWGATDTLVGHKFSTLTKVQPLKAGVDLIDFSKAVEVEGQPSADKAALIACLQQYHADNIAFYLEAHGAHWNVVGEDFTEYHELFEEIYEDAQEAIDPIAELLRKLNAPSLADIREVAAKATGETVADDNDPESLAEAVYAANEALLDQIVACINEATKINQQGVLNFLAERQDMHQKWSWQLRASLAPEEAEPEPAETPEVPGDMPDMQDAMKAAANWSCCGSKSLPIAETSQSWDGAAAKARIFAWAGFDGANPSPEKASHAFLIHDTANSDLKGAYKLPFADVVDGELKAIPSGIRAAASRLPNTDAPADVLKSARGIIDAYERKMNPEKSAESVLAEGDITVDTEKATRVTVTVTQSDDKETRKPSDENQAPEPDSTEAPAAVAKSETEPTAEPAVEGPAVEPTVEEPVAEEAVSPAVQALQDLGAVLVRASADERARIISKVAELVSDGEPVAEVVAEEPQPEVAPEVAEEPVVAPVEPEAEVAVEASAIDEVTAIAKSALDAAFAAQQEVAAVKAQLTELLSQKATVEADLAKALDVVGRLMDLPSGRKSYSAAANNSGTNAPWLSPVIQRMLDNQE